MLPSRPSVRAALRGLWTGLPWLVVLAVVTGGFILARGRVEESHEALGYLLLVLAVSSRRGRGWGFAMAILAFLCFDFFLLPPYLTMRLREPFDWVVLGSFLVTGGVAAHLLDRAKREAAEARARADEVNRFSVVGAEALNAGRAEEGVAALARMLRETVGVRRCEVFLCDPASPPRLVSSAGAGGALEQPQQEGTELVEYVVRYQALAVERPTGEVHVEPTDRGLGPLLRELPRCETALVPLSVRDRIVGVVRFSGAGRELTAAEVRFVEALAYYAALGVERVRLVGEAERAEALREANRLKDAMLAAVSHDLRTPLTTIKAVAQELHGREEGAAIIEAEADRLNRFVADLLDLSRLEGGSLTLRPELVPADDLLGAALQQVSARPEAREIRTRIDTSPTPCGRVDFVLALRSLVNLLDNACKHSSQGPIDVGVSRDGDNLVFTVADRGPGIADEDRERIFEPFIRGSGTGDGGGTGLGLSIARRLARAQGGDVEYVPREGGGSVFVLRLPAADMPLQADASA